MAVSFQVPEGSWIAPISKSPAPMNLRHLVLTGFLAVGLLGPAALHAQPRLDRIDPVGYEKADEIRIGIRGQGVDQLNGILFLSKGFEFIEWEEVENNPDRNAVARVRVAPDVKPGIHWLRIQSPHGVSTMEPFAIGDFPIIEEDDENNNSVEEPQRIELNHTVQGRITEEDTDYYVITLSEGQRVSMELEGLRLSTSGGRGRIFDPRIGVFGPDGEEIAFSEFTSLLRQDPYLMFEAPADGDYIIELRDTTFRGHNLGYYRFHVGEYVRPAIAFPLGAPAGEETLFTFIEDDGTVHEQAATVAGNIDGVGEVFFESNGLRPQAGNRVRVSDLRNVLADMPNFDREQATEVSGDLPVALNGILTEPGERAWFKMPLKGGTNLELTVHARPLGSPIDSWISIHNAEGRQLAENDDARSGHPDSRLEFEVPEDGDYYIRIWDQLNRGGPTYAYRIEVDVQRPGITLSNPQFTTNNSHYRQFLTIPRGGYGAMLMTVNRRRLADEVEFAIPDLPPGLELVSPRVPRGLNTFPLIVRASEDAELAGWFADLNLQAVEEETGDFDVAYQQPFDYVTGAPGYTVHHSVNVDRLAVAVTDAPPFRVRLTQPTVPLLRNGVLDLNVEIERDEDYTAPVKLFMLWRPNGVSSLTELNIGEGQTSGTYDFSANANAAVGEWDITVLAEAAAPIGNYYVAAEPVTLTVAESFLAASAEMTVVEQGASGEIVFTIEREREFAGEITFNIINAPSGVEFEPVTFNGEAEEVSVPFTASEEARVGRYGSLFVRAELPGDGGVMIQELARETVLRIDQPRPGRASQDSSGPRLSRLEQLRQEAAGEN